LEKGRVKESTAEHSESRVNRLNADRREKEGGERGEYHQDQGQAGKRRGGKKDKGGCQVEKVVALRREVKRITVRKNGQKTGKRSL